MRAARSPPPWPPRPPPLAAAEAAAAAQPAMPAPRRLPAPRLLRHRAHALAALAHLRHRLVEGGLLARVELQRGGDLRDALDHAAPPATPRVRAGGRIARGRAGRTGAGAVLGRAEAQRALGTLSGVGPSRLISISAFAVMPGSSTCSGLSTCTTTR
jgi:hypothetical protein